MRKNELQKSLIKQYIGFHDGFNHVRHAEIVLSFLKKNKKINTKRKWQLSKGRLFKSYIQHFLYTLAKGKYNIKFLRNWAEYYDIYSYYQLQHEKSVCYRDLDIFYQEHNDRYMQLKEKNNNA